MHRQLGFLLLATLLPPHALAENWPHWRGDSGNGVSLTAQPLTSWSETKNIRFQQVIPGRGSGSPVVWEDRIFVTSAVPTAGEDGPLAFTLFCLDRGTGNLRWKQVAVTAKPHEGTHATNGYASASPCTDGTHVYAHFGSQGTFCYTLTGELIWQRDLGDMQTRNQFGEGSSPTLAGDKLLVPWDHKGPSFLFALDKRTGETIWRTERDEPTCWATPYLFTSGGQTQVVMNGETKTRAYALDSGEELWRCAGQTERPVASPVGNAQLVFVGSGFRGSFLAAFRGSGRGDIQGTPAVAWSASRDTPDIASLLLSENRLYYTKGKSGILTCVDAQSGKPFYQSKRIGLSNMIYSSPIAAGGHVYLTDRRGTTVVIKDAPQLELVATNSVGETVDASLVPVDRELFIRGEQHLFCIAAD